MRQLLKITSIFALALVFTAGMAFGQGAAQNSDLGQGQDNLSVVFQENANGATQSATIEQAGTGRNISLLSQGADASYAGNGHTATIQQTGNTNYSNIFQQAVSTGHSEVTVQLQGDGNTVSRTGNRTANNGDNDTRLAGNSTFDVDVLGSGNSVASPVIENSDVDVTLDGDNNTITARSQSQNFGSTGPRSESSIEVLGSSNTVQVYQGIGPDFGGGGLPFPEDSFSRVEIQGGGNSVTVKQTDAPGAANFKLDRSSLLNDGFVNQ